MGLPGLRKQNRRKPVANRWRLPALEWRWTISIAGFFVLATVLGYGFVLVIDRPVQKIDVAGRFQRVTPAQVERAVSAALKSDANRAGFVSVDLAEVRRSVEALTWVERARVERSWPNGLRVQIAEQNPVARWGQAGLLNVRGELFVRDARHVPPELPQLNGPDGSEWRVAQLYLSTQGRLVEAGTRLMALTLDARGAVDLKLANGIGGALRGHALQQRFRSLLEEQCLNVPTEIWSSVWTSAPRRSWRSSGSSPSTAASRWSASARIPRAA
jgi:cell division protein FtsQ